MNNKDFMELLDEACAQTNSVEEMDNYLDEHLNDVYPYNLCFGKKRVIELEIDGENIKIDMNNI